MTKKSARTGVLCSDRLYTAQALDRIGIGRVLLIEARRSGVRPIKLGNRCWYVGEELQRWIMSKREHRGCLTSPADQGQIYSNPEPVGLADR